MIFLSDRVGDLQSDETWKFIPQEDSIRTDSTLFSIMVDSSFRALPKDTLIRAKAGLLERIFRARADTLVVDKGEHILNFQQIEMLRKGVRGILSRDRMSYAGRVSGLKGTFDSLRKKERDLIRLNYQLLSKMKSGVEDLRKIESEAKRKLSLKESRLLGEKTGLFSLLLSISLILMLGMFVFLLYFQVRSTDYERRLEERRKRASNMAEEKSTLLASISHEIRTPLISLEGMVEMLKREQSNGMTPGFLESVSNDIMALSHTVTDILNLNSIEAGALKESPSFFAPGKLLNEIVRLNNTLAIKKGIGLNYVPGCPENLEVMGDPFRTRQILLNLVSNAIKYTEAGKVTVLSTIIEGKKGHELEFVVRDTGIGIRPEDQSRVFEKYFIGEKRNGSQGFGIGMYISRVFAEQMNGKLTLQSRYGKGTKFTLKIPIDAMEMRQVKGTVPTLKDLAIDLPIVFIEDNPINLLFLESYFRGFPNIYIFCKSLDALEFIFSNPVHSVVTDIHMDNMDGWTVLKKIKEDRDLREIQVIAYSADPYITERNSSSSRFCFDGVLNKPFKEEEFVALILKYR